MNLNPGKIHLINFSQRKFIKDTSITMYCQPFKVTQSVKFLGVHIDNHLNMKLHVKHTERASFINRMRMTKLNSIKAAPLIRLYKTLTRPYTEYDCAAITALNKTQGK